MSVESTTPTLPGRMVARCDGFQNRSARGTEQKACEADDEVLRVRRPPFNDSKMTARVCFRPARAESCHQETRPKAQGPAEPGP